MRQLTLDVPGTSGAASPAVSMEPPKTVRAVAHLDLVVVRSRLDLGVRRHGIRRRHANDVGPTPAVGEERRQRERHHGLSRQPAEGTAELLVGLNQNRSIGWALRSVASDTEIGGRDAGNDLRRS